MYTIKKCIRFDEKTDEILKKNLEKKNNGRKKKISEADYLRQLVRCDNMEQIGLDREALIKCMRVLSGCGNNLNQIAHNMNMDIYTESDARELRQCMADVAAIREQIREVIKAVFNVR